MLCPVDSICPVDTFILDPVGLVKVFPVGTFMAGPVDVVSACPVGRLKELSTSFCNKIVIAPIFEFYFD